VRRGRGEKTGKKRKETKQKGKSERGRESVREKWEKRLGRKKRNR